MRSIGAKLVLFIVALLLGGCAVGYNSAMFVTRSNVGIDIQSTPPIAEISISRQEGLISPVFEGGQTPPLLGSFGTGSEGLLRVPFGTKSVFAGGGAAVALVNKENNAQADGLPLSEEPKKRCGQGTNISFPGPGCVLPLFLAVDTTLGAKIAWSGATSTVPDSLTIGYNRREAALAPVFVGNRDYSKTANT